MIFFSLSQSGIRYMRCWCKYALIPVDQVLPQGRERGHCWGRGDTFYYTLEVYKVYICALKCKPKLIQVHNYVPQGSVTLCMTPTPSNILEVCYDLNVNLWEIDVDMHRLWKWNVTDKSMCGIFKDRTSRGAAYQWFIKGSRTGTQFTQPGVGELDNQPWPQEQQLNDQKNCVFLNFLSKMVDD